MKTEEGIFIREFYHSGHGYDHLNGKFYIVEVISAAVSPRHKYLHPDLTWHDGTAMPAGSDNLVGYYGTKEQAELTLERWKQTQKD